MRIAVCDDNLHDLNTICKLAESYTQSPVVCYTDGNKLLNDLQCAKRNYDLIFLDIEMPINGFNLAKVIRQLPFPPLIVFVTCQPQYAVQGYGIAFRYLVKPIDSSLFMQVIQAAENKCSLQKFVAQCRDRTYIFLISEIYYLESYNHIMLLHSQNLCCELRMSISAALAQLPNHFFAMPHQSYIVNMQHIIEIYDNQLVMQNGEKIPISRRRKKEFDRLFNAYLQYT